MVKLKNYRHTKWACYIGYFSQAVVCCFVPLLFTIFNERYNIPLTLLGLLSTVTFITQFATDVAAMSFVYKIGYRACAIIAHILAGIGLLCLGILPGIMENTYAAVLISVIIFSVGGGLLEVLISPIVESCPSDNKAASMSLLHSMFAIGSIGAILLSSLFFVAFGKENWRYLAMLWAILPCIDAIYFCFVPIADISGEKHASVWDLFKEKAFWLFAVIMMCSGASEIAMSQWASAFAESSLGITKAVGDILGPCMFALMMTVSRIGYPMISNRIKLTSFMLVCSILCIISYLIAALSPLKMFALFGCGLCGFSVGIMWPGTLSMASAAFKGKNITALFTLMALAGDLGCTTGPLAVGFISSAFGDDLRAGLLASIIFPMVLLIGVLTYRRIYKRGI